jgi:uncharacterized protein YndB with AHSA1/START domain
MKNEITIERSYRATLDEVWELMTTKEGIEAWWGPEGFRVEVTRLELRKGGHLDWAMIADAPEMVEVIKQSGMKVRTEHRNTFTEVTPKTALGWSSQADFIPGVTPYPTSARVELRAAGPEVKVTVTVNRMHDQMWTDRQRMGWEMQLSKLDRLITNRRQS